MKRKSVYNDDLKIKEKLDDLNPAASVVFILFKI